MDKFKPKPDVSMETAFETTYQLVTGGINIQSLLEKGIDGLCLLYDPYELNEKELKIILDDMLEYFIEIEEYKKCQKIKNILNSNIKALMSKITLNDEDQFEKHLENFNFDNIEDFRKNSIDEIIDMLKNFAEIRKKQNREDLPFSNLEIWSMINNDEQLKLFENDYTKFLVWVNKLSLELRYFYIKRLLEEKPLTQKKCDEQFDDLFDDIEFFDNEIDYNQLIIKFSDNHTRISHSSLDKIKSIKYQLVLLGIIDSTIETTIKNGKKVHTIFWSSKQRPNKINWN